jgi:hypothetical protein
MSDEKPVVTLTDSAATFNYRVGEPIYFANFTDLVNNRPLRGARLFFYKVWWRISRPFRVTFVTTKIDHKNGILTFERRKRWWQFL